MYRFYLDISLVVLEEGKKEVVFFLRGLTNFGVFGDI